MPASLVTKILQIDQPIKDFCSSGQKTVTFLFVSPCLDGVLDYFRSCLLVGHGASLHAQYCSIPFNYPLWSPDVKATPTFHNSSSRKTAILVAFARVVGVWDWLTTVHRGLSGSRWLRGCSRSTTSHQHSIVVILVALARLIFFSPWASTRLRSSIERPVKVGKKYEAHGYREACTLLYTCIINGHLSIYI